MFTELIASSRIFMGQRMAHAAGTREESAQHIAMLVRSITNRFETALGNAERVSADRERVRELQLPENVGAAVSTGPLLMGTRLPAHLLRYGATVGDVVNLATIGSAEAASLKRDE